MSKTIKERLTRLETLVWALVFVNLGDAGIQYAPDIVQNMTRLIQTFI